jgi:hypothetical protein
MRSVIVTWHDAYSLDAWYSKVDIDEKLARQPQGAISYSQGFLYSDTEDSVTICQSFQPEDDAMMAGFLVIPRSMVFEVEVIKE